MPRNKLVIILGPTSSGKTALAVKMAKLFKGEIISADSRQIYKGMDIGTGKDLKEYNKIPYHLINIVKPTQKFSLAKYQKLAYKAINDIIARGKVPFLVGGTGLYLNAITQGYNLNKVKPDLKLRNSLNKKSIKQLQILVKKFSVKLNQSDFNNKRRLIRQIEIIKNKSLAEKLPNQPKYECLILGLTLPKDKLNKKINARLEEMFKQGLLKEVKKLHQNGVAWKTLDDFGLQYRFAARYLQNKLNYDTMTYQLQNSLHQFAKRQMTWFKRNKNIIWLNRPNDAQKIIKKFINS